MEIQPIEINDLQETNNIKIKFDDDQILETKHIVIHDNILEIHFDSGENSYENLNQIAIYTSHWGHFKLIDANNKEYDHYGFTFFHSLNYYPTKQEFILNMVKMNDTEIENLELKNNLEKSEQENDVLKSMIKNMQTENMKIVQSYNELAKNYKLIELEINQLKIKKEGESK